MHEQFDNDEWNKKKLLIEPMKRIHPEPLSQSIESDPSSVGNFAQLFEESVHKIAKEIKEKAYAEVDHEAMESLAAKIADRVSEKMTLPSKKCRVPIKDYPKTQALYVREKVNGAYTATENILEGSEWVFDPGVQAVDKLHGTNVCVVLDSKGEILAIDNRTQRLQDGMVLDVRSSKDQARALLGVLEAVRRGWFKDIHLEPDFTRVYGELIGPGINGNLHEIDRVTFVPFHHLKHSCAWKSWIDNKYPKTFDSISDWFKELPSLFSEKYCKKKVLAEGLVFWHPDGRVCKLRRDMYPWYEGKRH